MRVRIKNWMRYSYEKAVSFSPHVIRLYPRSDSSVVLHRRSTRINLPSDIQYRRDLFDNLVANCFLPEPSDLLEVTLELEIELWPKNPFHFLLAPSAVKIPFSYNDEEKRFLQPFLQVPPEEDVDIESFWAVEEPTDTVDVLVDLAKTLHREIEYEVRWEGEPRPPAETIGLQRGACRDTALLCATILRKTGLAVRVVSGFLYEFRVDVQSHPGESGLHAWVEVYLPGAGWVGIDPTNGTFCDHRFIPTAVGARMSDIAPIQGSYFGSEAIPARFEAKLDFTAMTESDRRKVAEHIERTFESADVTLTMGGEPTFVPKNPTGAEWSVTAVGPTKLAYAYTFATKTATELIPGGLTLYTPGKLYPGEVDPRWALHVLAPPGGGFRAAEPKEAAASDRVIRAFREGLLKRLGLEDRWLKANDLRRPKETIWALPLDHDGTDWKTERWTLRPFTLTDAHGPAGFRLPLGLLPEEATRRALVLEPAESYLAVFLPPLLTAAFQQLAETVLDLLVQECAVRLQGYVPVDLPTDWRRVAFTADPGVLEVNLPPCKTWLQYDEWIVRLTEIATAIGMCPFKQIRSEHKGTGGGSHLLFGGVTLDNNPFFSRPGWLASILRYWQHHPALSYLFTGPYVGRGSQAPRPDESGNDLLDLELTYRQIEQLPAEDCREQVQELLRHLHTDIGGNTHRSEISFDKFWSRPLGQLGLIEFRAIESTPQPEWTSTIALLWRAILAYTLLRPFREPLKDWGNDLHDRFFLPTPLWIDLTDVLSDLAKFGFGLDPTIFRAIWAWRFPTLLKGDGWEIRRGLDGWPLLAEVPSEGGTTSRFVDTSMERLEVACQSEFAEGHLFFFNGRELPLRRLSPQQSIAGIRYRKTALYPSLHPQIPPQSPLGLVLVERESGNVVNAYELQAEDNEFRQVAAPDFEPGKPCEPAVPGMITCDLRL